MKIIRKQYIETNAFQVGDQIVVGKYTATCQKVTDRGFIFLLDQYLDKTYWMNEEWTNEGGYEASDLQRNLKNDFAYNSEFNAIREYLIPFENGDLIRIPTVGEFFGHDENLELLFEMDNSQQWELMKIRSNRIAQREGEEYELGWLQNTVKESAMSFALVDNTGFASTYYASYSCGVRPVFMIKEAVN